MTFRKIWRKGLLLAVLAMALLTVCAGAEETENGWLPQQMESEQPAEASPKLAYADDPFMDLYHEPDAGSADGVTLAGEEEEPSDPYEKMKWDIKEYIKAGNASFLITNNTGKTMTLDDLDQLYLNTLYDYPEETYRAMTRFARRVKSYAPGEEMYIGPVYLEETDDALYQSRVNEAAAECFKPGMTTLEKVVAAHDWIVLNCQYDPYIANGGPYITAGGVTYGENDNVYTSYGVFVDGNAVCQGYALAFKVLLDRAGVPCCYVTSDTMHHAWNMVQLDENWYHVDVTWGDPVHIGTGDIAGHVDRDFFIKSDAEFVAGNGYNRHQDWSTEYGYTCGETYPMPAILANASEIAAYLIDDSFYVLSNGTLYSCPVGGNFASGSVIVTGISTATRAAAYDEDSRCLYFLVGKTNSSEGTYWWNLYELDLNASHPASELKKQTTPINEKKTYGLRLQDSASFPGAKELCTWYDYAAVESMLVGIESTAADMPVVIRFPASVMQIERLAGKSISVTINTLPEGVTDGSVYLASYDAKGKMEKIAALGSFGTETQGQLVIDSSHLPQNAATAKILTVSNLGTPLAGFIPCS